MSAASDARSRLIRHIHVAARNLGVSSEDRKAMQERVTGKASCADMNEAELRQVVAALTGTASRGDRVPEGAIGAKLTALWISAWHLGMIRDRTDAALAAFVRRQTGLSSASWLTPVLATRCVDALKDWMAREAGVDWRTVILVDDDGKRRHVDNPPHPDPRGPVAQASPPGHRACRRRGGDRRLRRPCPGDFAPAQPSHDERGRRRCRDPAFRDALIRSRPGDA